MFDIFDIVNIYQMDTSMEGNLIRTWIKRDNPSKESCFCGILLLSKRSAAEWAKGYVSA